MQLNALNTDPARLARLSSLLIDAAEAYFRREPGFPLVCAARINDLMKVLTDTVPCRSLSEAERHSNSERLGRMRRLSETIQRRAGEKLLLSELAAEEGVSLTHLSHYFRECFGMPFQEYVQRVRCREAAMMLAETDRTPSEISLCCGFSAYKYMKQGFLKMYGLTPAEYRERFAPAAPRGDALPPPETRVSMTPFAPHYTPQEGLRLLQLLRETGRLSGAEKARGTGREAPNASSSL